MPKLTARKSNQNHRQGPSGNQLIPAPHFMEEATSFNKEDYSNLDLRERTINMLDVSMREAMILDAIATAFKKEDPEYGKQDHLFALSVANRAVNQTTGTAIKAATAGFFSPKAIDIAVEKEILIRVEGENGE